MDNAIESLTSKWPTRLPHKPSTRLLSTLIRRSVRASRRAIQWLPRLHDLLCRGSAIDRRFALGDGAERRSQTSETRRKGHVGYGAVVKDADGVIWKLATSSKKEKGPPTRKIDDLVLLIGAADMGASKRFYVEHGLTVRRSFLGRYVEFDAPPGGIKLALYPGRAGLAKDAGVPPDGDGRTASQ